MIAIDWPRNKKVLGFWIKNSESPSNSLDIFSQLKTGGLQDVLIISCDNLSGISNQLKQFSRKQMFKNLLFSKLETRF
ncbi:transposase [Mesomycoplasma ovipneumoniae]